MSARTTGSFDSTLSQDPVVKAQSVFAKFAPEVQQSRDALDPLVIKTAEHRLNSRASFA